MYKFYQPVQALQSCLNISYDLALLDVMMPEMDGFELCKRIRSQNNTFPIIMLTAKVESMDKITGLSIGADDYITKPFHPLEMVARVKAQLRRYKSYNNTPEEDVVEYEFNGLYINKETHECTLYGKELNLRPIEFPCCGFCAKTGARFFLRKSCLKRCGAKNIWIPTNTVMVHIRRLREKMQEPARNPKFIKTVWG